jgi:hypothetical protein
MNGPDLPIPPDELRPGQRLARDLVDARGRVLLRAGEPVTEAHIALAEASGATLRLGEIAGALRDERLGVVRLVPASGTEIEASREKTRAWRIDRDLAMARSRIRSTAEAAIAHRLPRWERLPARVIAKPEASPLRHARDRVALPMPGLEWVGNAAGLLGRVYARLACGQSVSAGPLSALAEAVIDDLCADGRLAARLTLGAGPGRDALVEHALGVGVLASGVALRLGWAAADVRAAMLAGCLCDLGLTVLPTNLRAVQRPLTEEETNTLRRHPLYGAAMLERIRASDPAVALPESVQIAVHQHHERLDGSGYPGRLKGDRIHDLARLVGACDMLLALREDRAHRPGLSPEASLSQVVREAAAGRLDKDIVRALVATVATPAPGLLRIVPGGRVAA